MTSPDSKHVNLLPQGQSYDALYRKAETLQRELEERFKRKVEEGMRKKFMAQLMKAQAAREKEQRKLERKATKARAKE